ncbi:hypothetical protein [Yunchengibacter salinarum]|uniref:hypothetical protein n=1 Tax=Yunchengibacter salinarum TaxID=3133399 RepID=UPI0035B58C8E
MWRGFFILVVAGLAGGCAGPDRPQWLTPAGGTMDMDRVHLVHGDTGVDSLGGGDMAVAAIPADPDTGTEGQLWLILRQVEPAWITLDHIRVNGKAHADWAEVSNRGKQSKMAPPIVDSRGLGGWNVNDDMAYLRQVIVKLDPAKLPQLARNGVRVDLDRDGRQSVSVQVPATLFKDLSWQPMKGAPGPAHPAD